MRTLLTVTALLVLATAALALGSSHTAHADQRDFRLVNHASEPFVHVYVSPSNLDDWGDDVLDGEIVFPGDATTIRFSRFDYRGACFFDIRVDGLDGGRGVLWGVDLCSTSTVDFS